MRAGARLMRITVPEPQFIETVKDVERLLSRAGLYTTTSDFPAYSVLKALDWDPRVDVTEDLFGPHVNTIVVRVDPRGTRLHPNEKMGVDPKYWGDKLDAYPHWETAWWRECVQNARDARATQIALECVEEMYEGVPAVRCSVTDNGGGMSEEVLRRAFLTFGGTAKEAGSVGGFGDAKELIILPWLGYEIHTRDRIARGKHDEFQIAAAPVLAGTKVTAWMPREKATTATYAKSLLDRCDLPTITFAVNGRRYKADAGGGDLKMTAEILRGDERVGMMRVYHNPRSRKRGFFIRARGLYMFDKYVPESQYKGIVYIELEGNARDLFDQKRVNVQWRVSALVDRFIADLTVDRSMLVRMGKGKERKFYEGEKFEVLAGQASEAAAKLAMAAPVSSMKQWKDGGLSFETKQVDLIVEQLEREEQRDEGEAVPETVVVRVPSATRVMLEDTKFVGADHAANAMRLLAWKPAFLLVNEVDFYSVPAKARPEGMTPTYKTLLTLWAEICRFVLLRLGWTKPFGAGFIFSWDKDTGTTVLAAYTKESNVDFLMLNPFKLKVAKEKRDSDGDVVDITYDDEERWRVADEETLKMLCAAAIHEATHMVNGIGQHNESFATALTENMGALIDMLPVAKKIRSAVTSRKARAERRAPSEPKKKREVVFEQPVPSRQDYYRVEGSGGDILAEIQGKIGRSGSVEEWHAVSFVGGGVGPTGAHSWPMDTLDQAKKWVLEKLGAVEKITPALSRNKLMVYEWTRQGPFSWHAHRPDGLEIITISGWEDPPGEQWEAFENGRKLPGKPRTRAQAMEEVRRHFMFLGLRVLELVPTDRDRNGNGRDDQQRILLDGRLAGTIDAPVSPGDALSVWWNGKNYREHEDFVYTKLLVDLALHTDPRTLRE